jgi:hypothetical protein
MSAYVQICRFFDHQAGSVGRRVVQIAVVRVGLHCIVDFVEHGLDLGPVAQELPQSQQALLGKRLGIVPVGYRLAGEQTVKRPSRDAKQRTAYNR